MNEDPQTPRPSAPEMQFDRADFAEAPPESPTCAVCQEPLRGYYFELNEKMACERCRYEVEAAFNQRGGAGGFLRAVFAGLGAAIAGALLYYAVLAGTGYEVGLISIAVGFGVGYAVRWGGRAKGGWAYQTLAVLLTYLAIVSTYIPMIVKEIREQAPKTDTAVAAPTKAEGEPRPAVNAAGLAVSGAPSQAGSQDEELSLGNAVLGIGALVLFAMALPFLAGFENILGIAIIAFGLYEAWKLNRRASLAISGPFQLATAPPTPPANP